MISPPPIRDPLSPLALSWQSWFQGLYQESTPQSGTTANRPTKNLTVGLFYFDTTLGKPVWYEGPGWVDATGASV